jgi:CheY-like chemotaxis protein
MTNPTRIDRVNILLVDDQPSKLLTYETILGGLGEHLIKVSSATEALECLLKHDIAVVLVDVCMPDFDGYELAGMIRQHPRFQQTSIIFVSAILMTDLDRIRGYECGAVDYVPVPVVPEILRAKVSVFAELYRKTRDLERLNLELEQRVTERTAALEATTVTLQEADRRKDEFLAMVAHELRNPLAPIRTAAQLLRVKELDESHRARARDIIERQVDHLVCLIDDLLDVSRITRGVITLRREPVLLGADVPACVLSQTCRGTGTGQELAVIPDDDLAGYVALLVNPLVPVSTAEIFAAWDGIDRGALTRGQVIPVSRSGRNDLQKPAVALVPLLTDVLQSLEECQPVMARMSGSGATCFALFDSLAGAKKAERYCRKTLGEIWTMIGKFR